MKDVVWVAKCVIFTPHHITSHHIILHHITSHHITSHHITPHHITSYYTTSHHITSHHITPHHIISHHITSYHITPHHNRFIIFSLRLWLLMCLLVQPWQHHTNNRCSAIRTEHTFARQIQSHKIKQGRSHTITYTSSWTAHKHTRNIYTLQLDIH